MKARNRLVRLLEVGLASVGLLAGCGGGESGGSQDTQASDSEVVQDIVTSNISAWDSGQSGTNRWVAAAGSTVPTIQVSIPAPTNATETDLAAKARGAISIINQKLSGLVVLTEAPAGTTLTGGYVRVSYLTAYVPAGSTDYATYCSNVSTAPSLPNPVYPSSPSGQRNQTIAWVNLGNGHCDVSQDVATHEFGHALGLNNHFQGFGNGPAISSAFWDVLATLYANPVRTPAAQLQVKRAG